MLRCHTLGIVSPSSPLPEPPSDPPVSGDCAPGFESVREAFSGNFVERGEVGAAVTVICHGEVLVDLWGGWSDEARTQPWERDTLVDFYSVGKAIVATLVLAAVDRGDLAFDTPIAELWPEFARHGKERFTVADALSHRAAVPAIRAPLTDDDLFDWDVMTAAIADTEPWWERGTRHAYHTNTFGHLVGEIARRVTGQLPGEAVRPIADGLGADVWFGVPTDEQGRCADVIWDSPITEPLDADGLEGDTLLNVLASFNPPGYSSVGVVNTARWRGAQVPAAGGHGSARGIARFYAGLLEPEQVLSASLLQTVTQPASSGPCPILGEDVVFGLGFMPTTERRPFGPNPGSFGHFGTGGAVGFADPVSGIAFGYAMNHVRPRWQSSRNRALIDTLYAALH